MPAKSHGMSRTRKEYHIWVQMRHRCLNPKHDSYKWYGARGISVCPRWLGSDGFKNFWDDMGVCPPGLSLDRQDNNGSYTKENCRWATPQEQNLNKRKGVVPFRKSLPMHGRIHDLRGQGLSTRKIAQVVGLSKSQVWKLLTLL